MERIKGKIASQIHWAIRQNYQAQLDAYADSHFEDTKPLRL